MFYSYEEFEKDMIEAEQFFCSANYDVIIGLSRGGLIPAVRLSHLLKVPMIPVEWQTRDGELIQDINKLLEIKNKYKNILVVDDINDSGDTLQQVSKHITADYFTLLTRKTSIVQNHNTCTVIDNDEWVTFFWE